MKVEGTREEVKEAVIAFGEQALGSIHSFQQAVSKIPKEVEDLQKQILTTLIIEPLVDYLTGRVDKSGLWKRIGGEIKTFAMSQTENEDERFGLEKFCLVMVVNYFAALKPEEEEWIFRYFNALLKLSKERGVSPQTIFTTGELSHELFRSLYTRDQYRRELEAMMLMVTTPKGLFDITIKPIIEVLYENDEEKGRILAELKQTFEPQEKTRKLSPNASQFIDKTIITVFGE